MEYLVPIPVKEIELNFPTALYEKILPRNPFKIKRRRVDRFFSVIIHARDNYRCVRCKTQYPPLHKGLHVSHYYSRTREATRFDWDNVDLLCHGCHMLWSKNYRSEYIAYKQKQLGFFRYERLTAVAKIPNTPKLNFKKIERERTIEFKKIIAENKIPCPVIH